MTNYLEQAAAQLQLADEAAARMRKASYGAPYREASEEYASRLELATRYERLAAIDKGIAFPAAPGEEGQPS